MKIPALFRKIHMDPKFTKQLADLPKAGKKARIAAQKADDILNRLVKSGCAMPDQIGTVTKYGELRLKNCIKYDLGNGYRLITIRRDQEIFILYIGTHDECHRWVENNREIQLDIVQERCRTYTTTLRMEDVENGDTEEEEIVKDPLDERLSSLDDRELRIIFCGLAGDRPESPDAACDDDL